MNGKSKDAKYLDVINLLNSKALNKSFLLELNRRCEELSSIQAGVDPRLTDQTSILRNSDLLFLLQQPPIHNGDTFIMIRANTPRALSLDCALC